MISRRDEPAARAPQRRLTCDSERISKLEVPGSYVLHIVRIYVKNRTDINCIFGAFLAFFGIWGRGGGVIFQVTGRAWNLMALAFAKIDHLSDSHSCERVAHVFLECPIKSIISKYSSPAVP